MPFRHVTVVLGDPRLTDSYKSGGQYGEEDVRNVDILKDALAKLDGYDFDYLDDHTTLLDDLRVRRPEFVLNLCDTGFRNRAEFELNVPAYLEMLDIPYSGATPSCMVLTLDKAIVRAVAAAHGVPVPTEVYLTADDPPERLPDQYPVLIKPARTDGSFGITQRSVASNRAAAADYLDEVRRKLPGEAMLVQEFLSGTEYGIGIIGNPGDRMTVLPPLEVDYTALDPALPRLLGYESKAEPGSPYWTDIRLVEAKLDDEERGRLVERATRLYRRFGFRDYGRFDFRRDAAGQIKLMEMNTNPAWAWDGKLNFMAGFAGLAYHEMLGLILDAAQRRLAAAAE
jgi:D-alanine-D-alanine ligase